MSTYTNKVAKAVCKAMGMSVGFAAEKEPESPTLAASLSDYMQGISDEALDRIRRFGPAKSCVAALREQSRRSTTPTA